MNINKEKFSYIGINGRETFTPNTDFTYKDMKS